MYSLWEYALQQFHRESHTWSTFCHPHILPFLGSVEIENEVYIISQWMELGDIATFQGARVRCLDAEDKSFAHPSSPSFSFDETVMIYHIASAVAYLHSLSYVHGDIKASNILLSKHGTALLTDFGLSKSMDPHTPTSSGMKGVGTLAWQSPELLDGGPKSYRSDVYAFAMTIVEILTGAPPFPGFAPGALVKSVMVDDLRPPALPQSRLGIDFQESWRIAARCWHRNPNLRPSMQELKDELVSLHCATGQTMPRVRRPSVPPTGQGHTIRFQELALRTPLPSPIDPPPHYNYHQVMDIKALADVRRAHEDGTPGCTPSGIQVVPAAKNEALFVQFLFAFCILALGLILYHSISQPFPM